MWTAVVCRRRLRSILLLCTRLRMVAHCCTMSRHVAHARSAIAKMMHWTILIFLFFALASARSRWRAAASRCRSQSASVSSTSSKSKCSISTTVWWDDIRSSRASDDILRFSSRPSRLILSTAIRSRWNSWARRRANSPRQNMSSSPTRLDWKLEILSFSRIECMSDS